MQFFHKYKQLFGVQSASIPSSRLSLNNNLFIDKPFVPTYQQTISINSKLRDLKKDYAQFEEDIQGIAVMNKRLQRGKIQENKSYGNGKGKDSRIFQGQRGNKFNNSRVMPQIQPQTQMPSYQQQQMSPRNNILQISSPIRDPLIQKRGSWLRDEQNNLAKHSQMNYIFNHKIKLQSLRTKNPQDLPMPKAQDFMFGPQYQQENSQVIQKQAYQSAQKIIKDKKQIGGQRNSSTLNTAVKRREQANKNITARRQKLQKILKNSL